MATSNQSSKHSKPKQYQRRYTEFYKLKFKVTPDVLIPRPETELLVDEVLKSIKNQEVSSEGKIMVLDIGTGTGNIAVSIAKNAPGVTIIATDVSEKALEVAKQNAKLHGVNNEIIFLQSNLLSDLDPSLITLYSSLLIVTNLPYIPTQRIAYLNPSVKDFEPHMALDGGEDGFELYRKLFQQLQTFTPGVEFNVHSSSGKLKLLVSEIDYTHGELAINEALKYFPEAGVEIKTDFFHKQRLLLIRW